MSEVYFLLRHIPFWATPFIIIGGEMAYFFWLRKKKRLSLLFLSFLVIGIVSNSYYFWAGGPDKSVKQFKMWQIDLQEKNSNN